MLVPGECEHPSSKIRNPQNTKLWFSWEQFLCFWLNFCNVWTSHLTKLCRWYPQEINLMLYSCPDMYMKKYTHWLYTNIFTMENSNAVVFTWMSTSACSSMIPEITLTMVWQKVKATYEDFIHHHSSFMWKPRLRNGIHSFYRWRGTKKFLLSWAHR
jgi:hypothetical protein